MPAPITRFQADILLLITALIWGTAFIAQKTGMDGIGPLAFVGIRFALSFLFVLPLAFREMGMGVALSRRDWQAAAALCAVFTGGVVLQQCGMVSTTVTNAGFLTGLYVLGVPFAAWALFRVRPPAVIWACCAVALAGIWFLNGGSLSAMARGDFLILGCAVCFAVHVALLGFMLERVNRPLTLCLLQYGVCAVVAMAGAFAFESVSWDGVMNNLWPLLYAGIISGGIAYTLQAVAQRYTPPSDAAVIMSSEGLFAAVAGILLLGETLDAPGILGCALILAAILLVEASSFLKPRKKAPFR